MKRREKPLPRHGDEKGPWFVIEGGNFIDVSCKPDTVENHRAEGYTICEISVRFPFTIGPRERKIAQLIATAPKMLAALKKVDDLVNGVAAQMDMSTLYREIADVITEAEHVQVRS